MIKIAICDDNDLHREKSKEIVSKAMHRTENTLECFSGADELLSAITGGEFIPDIAVLDINMDGLDGISLARQLNKLVPACKIIFISSYLSYAQDVYTVEHVWFILKHDADIRMEAALSKAVSQIKQERGEITAIIKTDAGAKLFHVCDIIAIERVGLKSKLVCTDSEYLSSKSPAALIETIPESVFVRCHQSCWVNLTHIKSLDKDDFVLSNGNRITLSRTYKAEAKRIYFENI